VEYISIIEDYFLGKLKDEELESFCLQLKNNPRLKDEFEKYREAHNFIIYQEDSLVADLGKMVDFDFDPNIYLDINKYRKSTTISDNEKLLSDELNSMSVQPAKNLLIQKMKYNWIKIAAIVALIVLFSLVCILLCSLSVDNNELFVRYYSPYQASFDTRAIHNDPNTLFTEAFVLYKSGKYDLALAHFNLIPDGNKLPCLYLLQGICYIELKNYKMAIEQLDRIDEKSILYKESLWYKGLCLFKLNDDKNAKIIFNRLKSSEYFSERSKIILKSLK